MRVAGDMAESHRFRVEAAASEQATNLHVISMAQRHEVVR
jgi:hypothetical protein